MQESIKCCTAYISFENRLFLSLLALTLNPFSICSRIQVFLVVAESRVSKEKVDIFFMGECLKTVLYFDRTRSFKPFMAQERNTKEVYFGPNATS
jgi:hypothetical protein